MVRVVIRSLLVSGICAGCSAGLGTPIAQFPSRDDLEQVAEEPATPALPEHVVTVERWTLEAQAPAPGSEYPAQTPWDKALRDAVAQAKPRVVASPELRCAAQETARFFTVNAAFPDDGLRKYVLARCGSTLAGAGMASSSFELPDTMSESEVETFVKPTFDKLLEQLASGQGSVGVGFARGQGRGTFVMYRGLPMATVEPFSPLVVGDEIVFSGRLEGNEASALGLITQGRYGVLPCEPDRREVYPRFRLTCPVAKDDAQALVEVVTRRPERVLAQPVMRVLVRRTEDAGLVYESGAYTNPASPAGGGASFRTELLAKLNEARKAANVVPFQLEAQQSDLNEKVTPHFFEASFEQDSSKCDLVALGVLAGWDVKGSIRGGGVYAAAQLSTRDAGRWLNTALDSPLARSALLDGEMSRIAIGSTAVEPSGVMALVTTYAFFESNDHSAEEDAVFDEIVKQRAAHDLSPPRRRQRGKDMQVALQRIAKNEVTSGEALEEALGHVAAVSRVPIRGWIVETSDLGLVDTDDALLAPGDVDVEVGVTHYKAPGGAWAQYVVLLMFTTQAPSDTGQRAALDPR